MKKNIAMNRNIIIIFISFFFLACGQGSGLAEVKKASIPSINITPSLKSVMSRKDNSRSSEDVDTDGYILDQRNVIVDDLVEPKCIFYGNYNDGSGDANQYFDIDTIIFNCE